MNFYLLLRGCALLHVTRGGAVSLRPPAIYIKVCMAATRPLRGQVGLRRWAHSPYIHKNGSIKKTEESGRRMRVPVCHTTAAGAATTM